MNEFEKELERFIIETNKYYDINYPDLACWIVDNKEELLKKLIKENGIPINIKVLDIINSNRFYNERALKIANTREKVYIVFDTYNNNLVNVSASRKFADYVIHNDDKSYIHWIDWNVSENIKIENPLEMFIFDNYDIKGYEMPLEDN